MKAVAYQRSLPIDQPDALLDVALPEPVPQGRDVLVEVKAVSVNPVDTKVRRNTQPAAGEWKVLGWDVAGVVRAVGPQVTMFKAGDRVWYAGSIIRAGANSELHLVDERIVGLMPSTLDFSAAAALPLTSITAWEMLFDRLGLVRSEPKQDSKTTGESQLGQSILIIGAGGGVGSIMTQLAHRLTGLTVIGTASRPETKKWVSELGADHVIDHSLGLTDELKRIGIPQPNYIVSLTQTDQHFAHIVEAIAPQGKFGLIDDPKALDVNLFKKKSVSLHWESMFTRSMFTTADMLQQHHLLTEVSKLVDAGQLRTTLGEHFGTINATNLMRAHALLESGKSRGKIVLEGF